MAASSSLSRRSIPNISKTWFMFSRATSSTPYEHAHGAGSRATMGTLENERDVNIDNMSGVTAVAEEMVDLAKETMDNGYDNTKKTTRKVQEMVVSEADEHVVDTSEYRSIEDMSKHH